MQTIEDKRAYYRAYYRANKDKYRVKRRRYEGKHRATILKAKDKPCADCGGRWHPLVMEFDHLPGTEKLANVGDLQLRKCSVKTILAEIAKCEVVCPTCHRIRTLRRLGLIEEAAVAQPVEHVVGNDEVLGSNPNSSSTYVNLL